MRQKPKIDLFTAIRQDSRTEGLSIRALARKYDVHRRTVREAMSSAWPAPRRKPPPRSSRLDPFKPAIDQTLRIFQPGESDCELGLLHDQVTSELACPVGQVGRMSLCPSPIPKSSARTSCGSRVTADRVSPWSRWPPTSVST